MSLKFILKDQEKRESFQIGNTSNGTADFTCVVSGDTHRIGYELEEDSELFDVSSPCTFTACCYAIVENDKTNLIINK